MRSQANEVRLTVLIYSIALSVVLSVVLGACMVASGQEAAPEAPVSFTPSDRQILLHAEAQRHRVANGRDAQELDQECCQIAQRWAEHMAARRSMHHGGGEQIIAYGTTTAASTIRMWIGSAGHNAWLLSSTRRAGWGAAQSSGGTWYWAGAFRAPSAQTTGGTGYAIGTSLGGLRRIFRWRR